MKEELITPTAAPVANSSGVWAFCRYRIAITKADKATKTKRIIGIPTKWNL